MAKHNVPMNCFGGQAHYIRFFMAKFGGLSAKPHILWSNDAMLLQEISIRAGTLRQADRVGLDTLTTRYTDAAGQHRCTGVKKKLKASQTLVTFSQAPHDLKASG